LRRYPAGQWDVVEDVSRGVLIAFQGIDEQREEVR
jgi:hypothetical protein